MYGLLRATIIRRKVNAMNQDAYLFKDKYAALIFDSMNQGHPFKDIDYQAGYIMFGLHVKLGG